VTGLPRSSRLAYGGTSPRAKYAHCAAQSMRLAGGACIAGDVRS
jgi:hypothetical protein